MLTIAYVGFGVSVREYHIPYVEKRDDCKIKYVFRREEDIAQFAEYEPFYPEIIFTTDFNSVLNDPDVNLVVVSAPDKFHVSYAKQILNAGKHALIEKPFAPTAKEAREVFALAKSKGLICMPMSEEYVRRLQFPQMVTRNTDNHETAFTVSIDHVDTTTGISAVERSLTAIKVTEDDARPEDFRRPGHMFPLLARPHGGPDAAGRSEGGWPVLRGHEGRRHHDAGTGATGDGKEVGPEIRHHQGPAGLPQAP